MDSSLREWLVIIGLIIIVAVVFDGWRRVRRARQESLDIADSMGGQVTGTPLDNDYNPELPNGGYRIVGRVDEGVSAAPHTASAEPDEQEAPVMAARRDMSEDDAEALGRTSGLHAERDRAVTATTEIVNVENDGFDRGGMPEYGTVPSATSDEEAHEAPVDAEEFILVNVVARAANGFSGAVIREVAEACGMTLNAQGLYVRHERDTGVGPVQFSMANASESGRFDDLELDEACIRGLVFFVGLPGPDDPLRAFDYMLEMARYLAEKLDGELRDEQQSVMTQQTIDYGRQRIRDYLRRQKLAGGRT